MLYRGHSIKGIVVEIGKEVSGTSNHSFWRFQDLIIQHDQKFIKHSCISFSAEKLFLLKDIRIGDSVQVNFRIESKKSNDKWFTNLRAISIRLLDPVLSNNPEE